MDGSPVVQGSFRFQPSSCLQNETKSSPWGSPGCSSSTDTHIQETEAPCSTSDAAKETESPRFQALLRVTRGPWKNKLTNDIKSFSHELDPRGVRPFPSWKPRNFNNLQEVLGAIRARFDKAKEEVNSDLAIFAGDLVEILEKTAEAHPEWKESLEDLLVLARQCDMMSPGEFWLQCEGIVQDLDDRRQELPMGVLKQLHTRLLFILTRCTRLLQFHKEHGLDEDGNISRFHPQCTGASHVERPTTNKNEKTPTTTGKEFKQSLTPRFFSEEQKFYDWEGREKAIHPLSTAARPSETDTTKNSDSFTTRDRISSWKKLPSAGDTTQKRNTAVKEISSEVKPDSIRMSDKRQTQSDGNLANAKALEHPLPKESSSQSSVSSKHQHRISWGYWGDQQNLAEETYAMICRICEEEVPTSHLEEHLRICTIADRCDLKGLSVDERLRRISETLEKIMELYTPKSSQAMGGGSPDVGKACNMSVTEESEGPSPKLSDWSRRGSEDMLDYLPEIDGMDESRGLATMSCKTRFGPKSEQGMATSSAGSMTPRSPLTTPRTCQIDMLLAEKTSFCEYEDLPQINELVDIARCVATANSNDEGALEYLVSCLEDLRDVLQHCKAEALTVDTFGRRIERLLREKYLHVCEKVQPEEEKLDMSSSIVDEDGSMEDDVVRSLRASPVHPASKDRTSIDDFEILKPISRGAFGRVFLAKKRTTGDLFAIKVLRKADMIRKNAVESILAERNILISVRNPFVVRFFYSFTCRENLYLVMEYLNGGDLYSLLRNLGCLDEEMARVYIAEVVLALEYLHTLHVVHRDLKPDNLLIAHDGHIKLTDFGLSKVGLINSTDDLSGPAVSGTMLLGEDEDSLCATEQSDQRERRQKRSAVGTPDYLAPEILLGTGHAETADWWSVGIILFELLTGIPPFNAEHPQTIFDNILNRKIPWPDVPEEMSYEAMDLIDKLLTEDPNQRLGAKGAAEVKRHPFFKDINWDTLQRQKAAFVPTSDGALDTSYFTSRYMWNSSEGNAYSANNFEDISDCDSSSGSSSSFINGPDEVIDEGMAKFDNTPSVNYSFSNFSFKNLSQLASINYDLLTISGKDSPKGSDSHSSIS
jgi:serine/threonine protein kinase